MKKSPRERILGSRAGSCCLKIIQPTGTKQAQILPLTARLHGLVTRLVEHALKLFYTQMDSGYFKSILVTKAIATR